MRTRRLRGSFAALSVLAAAAWLAAGCGTTFKLPNEVPTGREIPTDNSYQMIATWTGMNGVRDILLLSQGTGSQLFVLFNAGGTGTTPRGSMAAYPLSRPTPIAGIDFPTLFNPAAVAAGANRLFVLDQGDTALARDPVNGRITDLTLYWRVREFGLLGGDTLGTFTDTSMAFVRGVAADASGRVYVSGTAIINVPDQTDPRILTRTFQFRVYRYKRGPRYPGVVPPDRNLPGADWHRDTTYVVEEGSGIGTVQNPFGLFWSPAGGPALYAVDAGKDWVQKLSDQLPSTGFYFLDGGQSGAPFSSPEDVTVDGQGFLYIADTGNRRVLRYAPDGSYVQKVNVELDADRDSLHIPVAVAADDSLAYVGDAQTHKIIRYKRRD
jgi:hypothetical protein